MVGSSSFYWKFILIICSPCANLGCFEVCQMKIWVCFPKRSAGVIINELQSWQQRASAILDFRSIDGAHCRGKASYFSIFSQGQNRANSSFLRQLHCGGSRSLRFGLLPYCSPFKEKVSIFTLYSSLCSNWNSLIYGLKKCSVVTELGKRS